MNFATVTNQNHEREVQLRRELEEIHYANSLFRKRRGIERTPAAIAERMRRQERIKEIRRELISLKANY